VVKQTICWILLALSISSLNIFTSLLSYANINAPPGAPGIPHRWAPALKQAIGTAYEKNTAHSPVWFTVAQGILTEVYYPHIDQAQIGDLQFLVTDGVGYFSEQKRDTVSEVNFTQDGASVLISGRERAGHYSFEQAIITDSLAPVVRIKTTLKWNHPGLRAFILFKPAINNTGAQNLGWVNRNGLFATKKEVISNNWRHNNSEVYTALMASVPWVATSVGYVGFSDGWQDLSRHFRLTEFWQEAGPAT
jgi:glucoamylase